MIIYKATNLINGKVYIGQTIRTLHMRRITHLSEARRKKRNHHFHNSLNKHGFDNFKWETIDSAKTQLELNQRERFWILFYDSTNPKYGYNRDYGGSFGKRSKETRQKMSRIMKGRKFSKEHCENISKAKKGLPLSEKAKKSMKNRKNGWTKELREKKSIAMKRENLDPAIRRKISDANTGEGNGRCKITEDIVIRIKHELNENIMINDIAKKYCISRYIVSKIKNGKTWRHVKI